MASFLRRSALKFIAIGLAIGLWYFVTSDTITATIKTSIEIKNLSPEMFLLTDLTEPVEVRVRGPEFLIAGLIASPPTFKIALPELQINGPKNTVIDLSASQLGMAPSIEVLSVEPEKVELVFDQKSFKKVKVHVPKTGALPSGLSLESLTAYPETVLISGPTTELKKLSSIETYPLDLGYIKESVKLILDLKKPGKFISIGFSEVEVQVNLKQAADGK